MTVRARPAQAYFLQPYQALPTDLPTHSIGATGEVREICPQCDRPLSTLLSLNPSDGRLELSALGSARLNLCVCLHCHQARYTIASDGEVIAIESLLISSSLSEFELVPPEFCPVALHAVPDRIAEARTLDAEGRLDEAGIWANAFNWGTPINQVGGRPARVNSEVPSPKCPLCGKPLPFLASIVCGMTGPAGETETRQIQVVFFLCRECPAVIAITPDSMLLE